MISSATLNALDPIVDLLYTDGVSIVPFPASMVAVAVASSKSSAFQMDESNNESFIDAWLKDLETDPLGMNTPAEIDGTLVVPLSLHTRTIEDGGRAIFEAADRTVAFVSNKLVPQVNCIIDAVNQRVEEAYRPVEEWQIVEAKFLPLYDHPAVKQILTQCEMGDMILPNLMAGRDYMIPVPPQDGKTVSDFLHTGLKSLEKALYATLRELDLDITTLYNSVFGGGGVVGPTRHAMEMRNLALCQLLLVYMLEENPWPGSGLSSAEWDLTMATVKSALSKSVAIYYEGGKLSENSDMLVQDVDYKNHKIYVESEIYGKWLDDSQANCPEILMGLAMLKESGVYTRDQANNMRDSALSAWSSYHASKQQAVESNRLSVLRVAILASMLEQLECTEANDLPPGKMRQTIANEMAEAVNKLNSYDVEDLSLKLIELVCCHLYPHTGCYQFAQRYHHISIENPQSSPEERELKAVIEFITDFTSAQIAVGKR